MLALVAEVAAVDDGWSRSISAFQKWAMVAENLAASEAFASSAPGTLRRRGRRGLPGSAAAAGRCWRRSTGPFAAARCALGERTGRCARRQGGRPAFRRSSTPRCMGPWTRSYRSRRRCLRMLLAVPRVGRRWRAWLAAVPASRWVSRAAVTPVMLRLEKSRSRSRRMHQRERSHRRRKRKRKKMSMRMGKKCGRMGAMLILQMTWEEIAVLAGRPQLAVWLRRVWHRIHERPDSVLGAGDQPCGPRQAGHPGRRVPPCGLVHRCRRHSIVC